MVDFKHAIMTYETFNVGDEVQSIAASQFLPNVDLFIDRDRTSTFSSDTGVPYKLIMNGWYSHWPENWPPSPSIRPLLTSMHITRDWSSSGTIPAKVMLKGGGLDYFKANEPIGARDFSTLSLLKDAGVDAYFSGCMTLTLQRPDIPRSGSTIITNDVPKMVLQRLQELSGAAVRNITQITAEKRPNARFQLALQLLQQYASARLVVTSRLHCALPSVAFQTPTILITSAEDQTRFRGFETFFTMMSEEQFLDTYKTVPEVEAKSNHLPVRGALIQAAKQFIGENYWKRDAGRFEAVRKVTSASI